MAVQPAVPFSAERQTWMNIQLLSPGLGFFLIIVDNDKPLVEVVLALHDL